MNLSELLAHIAEVVEVTNPEPVWVRAELSAVNTNRTGHCYLELSQTENNRTVAQCRAVIWASVFRQIDPYFKEVAGTPLSAGQKVLLLVSPRMSPLYGLSLIVEDIDPSYTVGDAQRLRQETIERLRKEGLMDAQRRLCLPELPRRFAVISAEGAAGYRDFVRHLHENDFGFSFSTTLFPSPMQGDDCACGISSAIGKVISECENATAYDAVLILRGGGGQLDLACYDEYEMCQAIARCPIPVLTAIGHDKDTHICDMVAYDAVKTPTALADYFLDIFAEALARLDTLSERLKNVRRTRLALMKSRLDILKARLEAANPSRLLEKGYTLVLGRDGKLLKLASGAEPGDEMEILFPDGRIKAKAVEIINR